LKITEENFNFRFEEKSELLYRKRPTELSHEQAYFVLGSMINEHIAQKIEYSKVIQADRKKVYYLSMEFLIGRLLSSNVLNLDLLQIVNKGLAVYGLNMALLEDKEADAGLGNGGLGRLAACFLDSIATMNLPGHGSGLRYKFGLFKQKIVDGEQIELPDDWLTNGNVWEIKRSDETQRVRFGGKIIQHNYNQHLNIEHIGYEEVFAVPYDLPVVGYKTDTVNTLRLWESAPSFVPVGKNQHDYYLQTEAITQNLYPDDSDDDGKILRLKQQYFLVSATLQNVIAKHKSQYGSIEYFNEHINFHINDTHPAMAIPEFMRILLDEEKMSWEIAWEISKRTFAYTNHTILAEAMEKWPIYLFEPLLPRIYQIINEINNRFCHEVLIKYKDDYERVKRMSILANGLVNMAHLCIVGSFSTNGVAAIHTEIIKNREMNDFYKMYPERFNNKTNGVTFRRWLFQANPELTELIERVIGPGFKKDLSLLQDLAHYAKNRPFLQDFAAVKHMKKKQLAEIIFTEKNLEINPNSMFVIQVKRLHAYKRQLLSVLHIMHLYNEIKDNPEIDVVPRTFIFGAKAAPGYIYAKKVIKLINVLADKVNNDVDVKDKLSVVFLENYRVSSGELLFPAADLSVQISTATKEASGTGNMKFMLNGGLTIGTLDGANVEIVDRVGLDNAFIFGLEAEQVLAYNRHGGYRPLDSYHAHKGLRRVVEQLVDGFFETVNPSTFKEIYDELIGRDEYFVLKDFEGYINAHEVAADAFVDREKWFEMSTINVAKSPYFSSDRTIDSYAKEIWNIEPVL